MSEKKLRPYEVPEHLRKNLKKGEFAVYRLLDTQWIGDKFSGRSHGIPAIDTIQDKDGNLHSIGYVTGYDNTGSAILGDVRFSVESFCQIVLHSGVKDANMYAYLENTNFNKSNPLRDPSIAPSFERVDNMTSALDDRKHRALKMQAMHVATELTDEEVLTFVTSHINHPDAQLQLLTLPNGQPDIEQLRNAVESLAERKPEVLLKMSIQVPKSELDSTLDEVITFATTNKVVSFDRDTKQWYNSTTGKPFLRVGSILNDYPRKELKDWLKTDKGKKIREQLTDAMSAEPVSKGK